MKYFATCKYRFDASVMEIYCCLLNGHTLVIPDREERVNPEQLQQLINKHRVTVASIPLQMCSVMEDFYIEKLITGGQLVRHPLLNILRSIVALISMPMDHLSQQSSHRIGHINVVI